MNWETLAAITLVLIGSAGVGGAASILLQFTLLAKLRRKIEALTVARNALPSNDAAESIQETRARLDQRLVELTGQLINETSGPRRSRKAPPLRQDRVITVIATYMIAAMSAVIMTLLVLR